MYIIDSPILLHTNINAQNGVGMFNDEPKYFSNFLNDFRKLQPIWG